MASSVPPASRLPGRRIDFTGVDQTDATAVSKAVVITMWTVDAAVDRGQRDAYLRAAPLLEPAYAASIADQPGEGVPSAWRQHQAYSTVNAVQERPEGDVVPDTATATHRQWRVAVTATGRDGWTPRCVNATVFVRLRRFDRDAPWRVAAVTTV